MKKINNKTLFFSFAIFTSLALILISGLKIYAVKITPYVLDPCKDPIESTQINKLKSDIKAEIGQQNFDLKLSSPNKNSICITVGGYRDGKELENLVTKEIDFYTKPIKTGLITKYPDFMYFVREVFIRGFIAGKGDLITERGEEAANKYRSEEELKKYYKFTIKDDYFNEIKKLSSECIKKFSGKSDKNEEIVFTGFGASAAAKEFQILFSIFSENKIQDIKIQDIKIQDIKIQDIHLIDPVYEDIINYFSSGSTNNFELFTKKETYDNDCLTIKNFKKIINYTYLLNKKLQTKYPIRLFLHKDVQSYLDCIKKFHLDKANVVASFFAAEKDLISLIALGTQQDCLFLMYRGEKNKILTTLNAEGKRESILKIMEINKI